MHAEQNLAKEEEDRPSPTTTTTTLERMSPLCFLAVRKLLAVENSKGGREIIVERVRVIDKGALGQKVTLFSMPAPA
jgi:hypothetical protein